MKNIKHSIFALTIFLLPILTYADCTEEEINEFQSLEEEYKIEYTLNKINNYYSLKLYNPNPPKYTYEIKGRNTIIFCEINQESDTECDGIPPGSYSINIVGNTETCDKTLKRTYLNLKPYNKYSEDSLCEDIKEFILCQETYDKEIDYDTFVSRVKLYKESKNQENTSSATDIIDFTEIKEYVENNLLQIIIIAVFSILVIVTIIITTKSYKKSRRLE